MRLNERQAEKGRVGEEEEREGMGGRGSPSELPSLFQLKPQGLAMKLRPGIPNK